MEILSPTPFISNMNWLYEDQKKSSTNWTHEENKLFENTLAVYDKETPDRWQRVASMIPGKSVSDVMRQYQKLEADVSNIEAGLIPIPGYNTTPCPFTLDWVNNNNNINQTVFDEFKHNNNNYGFNGAAKRSSSVTSRPSDQERKKGVPWTEDEHKLFLMGLKKYGKGDWRNISRNYVITRTPTQVASHAQKYFIRQLSGGKDKRRASIHDITTVNLSDTRTTPSPENKRTPSPEESMVVQRPDSGWNESHYHHHHHHHVQSNNTVNFNATQVNVFMSSSSSSSPYDGFSSFGQNVHRNGFHEPPPPYVGSQIMGFQMQSGSGQHYSHG